MSADFSERLKAARERAGLTQYELARRTGLSRQALSVLEKGDRDPNWQTVQLLCLALGVGPEEFLDPAIALPAVGEAKPRGRPAIGKAAEGPRKGRR